MAEQQPQEDAAPKKKGVPVKTVLLLGAFLVVEAVTVLAVIMMTGKPSDVHAEATVEDKMLSLEQRVEELVVEDKFVNQLRGETIIYDTEVYVIVRRKYQEKVQDSIEIMKARLTTDVANIIRAAQPAHFNEPEYATLTRQIKAALDKRFGRDLIEDAPYVEEVLVKRLIPYKADQ